ncbi:MAG: 3-phosphoshikimate 1-carboxyvinyltransferase [Pseudomonadota bacterium]
MIRIEQKRHIKAEVVVPGSKSLTQRALVAAALAEGRSILNGALISEDTSLMMEGLQRFGAGIKPEAGRIMVDGTGGIIKALDEPLYMGNNGTGMRFLTAVSSLGPAPVILTGSERMKDRPIQDLLDGLESLGVKAESISQTGCPPVKVSPASGLAGGRIRMKGSISSQFISAILLAGPYARESIRLELEGEPVSVPYISMTLKVMSDFGVSVGNNDYRDFEIPLGRYRSREYEIEGDVSNASYFWAAAAVTGGSVCVSNIFADSVQGDIAFVDILKEMGCTVEKGRGGILVSGPERLRSVQVDMKKWPDVVPTLAVVASQAEGETIIRNVSHLRVKETDRLHAVAVELEKIGTEVDELPDGLIIRKGSARPAVIETYNDHRMAMSFAVAGLVLPGLSIAGEECVAKSFPNFWEVFEQL